MLRIHDGMTGRKQVRIAVTLVDRANYGRLKPVMKAMSEAQEIDMRVVCAGTMLLDRFGKSRDVLLKDGFCVDEEVFTEVEGSLLATMAKSVGLAVIEFANVYQRLKPDFVLLIGDRYEALGAAIAAVYQNICLIHLQGGEVTGSIDESSRHAITKLAHYHFPATRRATEYVIAMGEDPSTVFWCGCPSADVVHEANRELPHDELSRLGVGTPMDFSKAYLLVLFHPVTTEFGGAEQQMEALLAAVKAVGEPVVLLWPNIDADSDGISQAIRRFRELNKNFPLHAYKNFEPDAYVPILSMARCAVGNSSSFVRDASFLGTPVVLVGGRQDGRELSKAVIRVEPSKNEILKAIIAQLSNGRYPASDLYGIPGVSKRIVKRIIELRPYSQKRLFYPKHCGDGQDGDGFQ
jgi:UDP-hydrolysing UDP-N-acetyl-D-glucosamine 2-epimerase